MWGLGTPLPAWLKIHVQLLMAKNLTTNNLLLTGSFTDNLNTLSVNTYFVGYMYTVFSQ